jgi:DNA-binding response OmpR family regulator
LYVRFITYFYTRFDKDDTKLDFFTMDTMLIPQSKILIVDDEPNILTAVEFLLQQHNFDVQKATDGQEALKTLDSFHPNIIILDVMMPGIDGFEVARQIRNKNKFDKTQIIFLTAKGTDKDRWQGYSAGGETYLTKPFDNQTLIDAVMEIIV